MVLLSDEKDSDSKLRKLAEKHKLKLALTINKTGKKAPKNFKINDKVKHTVLIYKGKRVKANFALNEITEDDVKEISKTTAKVFKG